MKIVLACAAGMSTSMLVDKMVESAKEKSIELEIQAVPVSELPENVSGVQLILLGPQVSYLEADVASDFPSIPVAVIDMMDYGMMNGEKVLNDAIQKING